MLQFLKINLLFSAMSKFIKFSFELRSLANKPCLLKLKSTHGVGGKKFFTTNRHCSVARFSHYSFNLVFSKNLSIHSRPFTIMSSPYFTKSYFVNGQWKEAESTFPVNNPFNGDIIGYASNCSKTDVEEAIACASSAFKKWKKTTGKQRAAILQKWFNLILENSEELAKVISLENGKPIRESVGEVRYAAGILEWLYEEAKRTYGLTIPSPHPSKRLMTIKQPIGVAGMITPWNFPSAMITRKACSAIAAGCTVVLKPSEDTPFSALALAKLAEEAGLPDGVLNVLPSSRSNAQEVGEVLCQHPDVAALSFTGSTAVGKALLKQSADTVKKVSLELGGLAPFIVFDSADLDKAVTNTIICKFRYMGQTCVCANRIFVHENIHDQYIEKLVEVINELKLGDPMDHKTTFGPMINEKAILKAEAHVEDALAKGAKLVIGGTRGEKSNFFLPTLITDVREDMLCSKEETFGPIAAIIKFKTENEVIQMANNTRFGLAGYFFSRDVQQCFRVAEALEVGMVGVNEGLVSTAEAPFGGVKESGLGREGSCYALDEFTEMKYICWGV